MGRKKCCNYCDFKYPHYAYNMQLMRGDFYFENSFEGYLRKMPTYAELVIELEGYKEETAVIAYCPWCGRKLV